MRIEKLFNKMKSDILADGGKNVLINSFLGYFAEEIAEEWGVDMSFGCPYSVVDGKDTVIQVNHISKKTRFVVATDGSVYKVALGSEMTGNQTWNGDDEIYDEFREFYTDVNKVGNLENTVFYENNDDVTSGIIESIACELIQFTCDLD